MLCSEFWSYLNHLRNLDGSASWMNTYWLNIFVFCCWFFFVLSLLIVVFGLISGVWNVFELGVIC